MPFFSLKWVKRKVNVSFFYCSCSYFDYIFTVSLLGTWMCKSNLQFKMLIHVKCAVFTCQAKVIILTSIDLCIWYHLSAQSRNYVWAGFLVMKMLFKQYVYMSLVLSCLWWLDLPPFFWLPIPYFSYSFVWSVGCSTAAWYNPTL